MTLIIKALITALLVTVASAVAKRSTFWGGVLTSLPVNSILVLSWLYWDTKDTVKVATLCNSILLMIFPTLVFFIILPLLLKRQIPYGVSLATSCAVTACFYWLATCLYAKLGWKI